jgi:hypothetical protein
MAAGALWCRKGFCIASFRTVGVGENNTVFDNEFEN